MDERERRTYGNGNVIFYISYGVLTEFLRMNVILTYFCNGNGWTARKRELGNQASQPWLSAKYVQFRLLNGKFCVNICSAFLSWPRIVAWLTLLRWFCRKPGPAAAICKGPVASNTARPGVTHRAAPLNWVYDREFKRREVAQRQKKQCN